eukprot:CAMPEP_0206235386 /NCGR_PEP_ID=MMETSP0047_2-20121206/13119_1 /ASSEMBLY_ACC=CAM_ASM_000192 /TAXON_ID=195065 /ORGANISM="Chroomonas mesostigmatica_cf, Strain CCMP1168" /LENGTH=203 /DNA_ID=CAMNT_0053659581 /DNA_START=340 /DNA_END=951 /DNA_ORIENTATION=+
MALAAAAPWMEYTNEAGAKYYHNAGTGATQWNNPAYQAHGPHASAGPPLGGFSNASPELQPLRQNPPPAVVNMTNGVGSGLGQQVPIHASIQGPEHKYMTFVLGGLATGLAGVTSAAAAGRLDDAKKPVGRAQRALKQAKDFLTLSENKRQRHKKQQAIAKKKLETKLTIHQQQPKAARAVIKKANNKRGGRGKGGKTPTAAK